MNQFSTAMAIIRVLRVVSVLLDHLRACRRNAQETIDQLITSNSPLLLHIRIAYKECRDKAAVSTGPLMQDLQAFA